MNAGVPLRNSKKCLHSNGNFNVYNIRKNIHKSGISGTPAFIPIF
jgi:hypothetical protein